MKETGWKEKDNRTIKMIHEYLERKNLDAFIPFKPTHVAYLTNYFDRIHTTIPWEEMWAYLIIPKNREAFCVGAHDHFMGYIGTGIAPWWIAERHGTWSDGLQAIRDTVELVKKKGLSKGRIGIEKKWMPVNVYEVFHSALPDVEFVGADTLVPQIRLVKMPREQIILKKAAEVGLSAMEAYMQAIRLGADRREAELIRAKRCLEFGAEWVGGANRVAWTGGTNATPAWWDKTARLQFQSTLSGRNWQNMSDDTPYYVTHFETVFQSYYSDLAWCQFYGPEPNNNDIIEFGGKRKVSYREARVDYEIIRRIQRESIQGIKPGMDQFQAADAIEDYLKSDPELEEHQTGYFIHGIGLDIHEEPILARALGKPVPREEQIYYQPGAVISSEWFSKCWTVEDPFIMTETEWQPLARMTGLIDPASAAF